MIYEKFEAAIERIDAFTAENFSDYTDSQLSKLFRDWAWLKRPGTDRERAQACLEDAVGSDSVSLGEILELFLKAWDLKRGKLDFNELDSVVPILERIVTNLDLDDLCYLLENLFDQVIDKMRETARQLETVVNSVPPASRQGPT